MAHSIPLRDWFRRLLSVVNQNEVREPDEEEVNNISFHPGEDDTYEVVVEKDGRERRINALVFSDEEIADLVDDDEV